MCKVSNISERDKLEIISDFVNWLERQGVGVDVINNFDELMSYYFAETANKDKNKSNRQQASRR